MDEPFDYNAFDRRSATIVLRSKGKTFAQLAEEVDALREVFRETSDESAWKYVSRKLDRTLLMFAIDASLPRDDVDPLYQRNVQQGFNDLHSEVASAIEYADYCREQHDVPSGLHALHEVREKLCAMEGEFPGSVQRFLQAIEETICLLEQKRDAEDVAPD